MATTILRSPRRWPVLMEFLAAQYLKSSAVRHDSECMITEPTRDFIGYGGNPPDPKWPKGARLALNFVMNFEEGSEPSFADGDAHTEAALTEVGPQGVKGRDLAANPSSNTAAGLGSGVSTAFSRSAGCR